MSQTSCRVNVRLYVDKSNKRTFKKFTIEEFPILKKIDEAKQCFIDTYQDQFDQTLTIETIELGCVGYSNVKSKIKNDEELKKAYNSKMTHKDKCPVFYIEPKEAEVKKRTIDLSSDEEPSTSAPMPKKKKNKNKKKSEQERVDELVERLRKENGDSWPLSDYRLWAVALDRNLHDSFNEPPDYPHFRKKVNKEKAKQTASGPSSTTTTRSANRTDLLAQLTTLQQLKGGDCTPRQRRAYDAEIDAVLDELEQLRKE